MTLVFDLFLVLIFAIEFGDVVHALEILSPIVGGIGTLILTFLYYKQHNILEEQNKLSKANQTPHLTGPHNIQYIEESDQLEMYLSNSGNGPARHVTLKMTIAIPSEEEEKVVTDDFSISFGRVDAEYMSEGPQSNILQPNETEVPFRIPMSAFDLDLLTDKFRENNIGAISIRFSVEYTDQFGESEDPFGQEYRVYTVETLSDIQEYSLRELLEFY